MSVARAAKRRNSRATRIARDTGTGLMAAFFCIVVGLTGPDLEDPDSICDRLPA